MAGSHKAPKKHPKPSVSAKGGARRAETAPQSNRKPLLAVFGGALALLVLVGAFIGVQAFLTNRKPVLPKAASLTMVTENSACKVFVAKSIKCSMQWKASNKERGSVIEQSPAAGEHSLNVKLTYSSGPKSVTMPILSGLSLDAAEELLWKNGLKVGEVEEKNSSSEKGLVLSESVSPGDKVDNGTSIDLVISTGAVEIPDWTGKTEEFVTSEAANLGIKVSFEKKLLEDEPFGTVVSQSAKGLKKNSADGIVLTIAIGEKEKAAIPNVDGMTQEQALVDLSIAGFKKIKTIITIDKSLTTSKVTAISPAAGTSVDTQKEITLRVSKPAAK